MKPEITTIDIAWQAILKVVVAIVLFWIIYLLRSVIVWVILALFISILFNPLIEMLEKKKIKRVFATVIVYLVFLSLIALALFIMIPPLVVETRYFGSNFGHYFNMIPTYLSQMGIDSFESLYSFNSSLNDALVKISSNIFGVFASLFGSLFAGLTIFTLSIYMSIEEKEIIKGLRLVSPKKFEEQVLKRWERSQHHVVAWFGSRVLACICVAIMTFLLCVFLKIKFALALALLSGIMNMIPIVGPITAGIIVSAFALAISVPKMVIAIIFVVLIQQIENNILTPIFTRRMSGLPSILVLISILVGGVLGGIVGAILAIPMAGIIFEALKDYFTHRKNID
jgi:predicted PurR-regulated permease PerM